MAEILNVLILIKGLFLESFFPKKEGDFEVVAGMFTSNDQLNRPLPCFHGTTVMEQTAGWTKDGPLKYTMRVSGRMILQALFQVVAKHDRHVSNHHEGKRHVPA